MQYETDKTIRYFRNHLWLLHLLIERQPPMKSNEIIIPFQLRVADTIGNESSVKVLSNQDLRHCYDLIIIKVTSETSDNTYKQPPLIQPVLIS